MHAEVENTKTGPLPTVAVWENRRTRSLYGISLSGRFVDTDRLHVKLRWYGMRRGLCGSTTNLSRFSLKLLSEDKKQLKAASNQATTNTSK